ncbi:MAG: hypothetical protein AB7K52_05605 [Phycisphaerales bacterium]
MILFAVYAVIVWYLVAKNRRRVSGFAYAIGGAALAAAITWGVGVLMNIQSSERIPGRGYQLAPLWILMWAEAIIVGAVGLFIAALPRNPIGRHCSNCWYDTSGLRAPVCPECGRQIAPEHPAAPAEKSHPGQVS